MSMLILSILFGLAITLCLEAWIYMLLKRHSLKLLLIVTLMNLVLNPTMNIILYYFGNDQTTYWIIVALYEVGTTIVESLIVFLFMRFKYYKVLLIALFANAASFIVGLALAPTYNYLVVAIILTICFFIGYLVIYFLTIKAHINTQKDN